MAFSKKDKDFLKDLPGETRFLDDAQTKPIEGQSNRVYFTNSKGFKKDVSANDMHELSHGLKKGAENFNVNAETRKFATSVQRTDGFKWVDIQAAMLWTESKRLWLGSHKNLSSEPILLKPIWKIIKMRWPS
ncbi:MAG: hypothetical protein LUC43_05535 [Burkholderiales bacterium]|nr:hypothetical protein [Burkholderiales bacterium]